MPNRPSVPPRCACRSTTARPRSSHAGSRPCCAAQMIGPRPPGPPPMMTDDNMADAPLREHVVEYAGNTLDHLFVDRVRGRQVQAGGRKLDAVGAGAGVLAVGRQDRERMEERPRLD